MKKNYSCPYCPGGNEMTWGFSPEGWEQAKERHEKHNLKEEKECGLRYCIHHGTPQDCQPSPKIGWEERFDEKYPEARFKEGKFDIWSIKSFISQLLEEERERPLRTVFPSIIKKAEKKARQSILKEVREKIGKIKMYNPKAKGGWHYEDMITKREVLEILDELEKKV